MKKMNLNVPENSELRLKLRDHQIFSANDAAGLLLECLSGGVWATFDGDRADHFLQAGERFFVATSGQAVIQALGDSEIVLFARVPETAAQAASPNRAPGPVPRAASFSNVCRQSAETATDCWRNVIASVSASRLGLERTF